jgi:hypothetical protein
MRSCKLVPFWLPVLAAVAFLFTVVSMMAAAIRHHAAIAEIDRLGGNVQTTQGEPDWLRRLLGHRLKSFFERATVVNLSGTQTADSDLDVLNQLRGVERLALRNAPISDAGLERIGRLTGLKALDLGGTQVTDQGIAHLAGLRDLEYLYLEHTEIRNAGLTHLERLHHLRTLALTGTEITDIAVKRLQKVLPGLQEIKR